MLVTSLPAPPVLDQVAPLRSGSDRSGVRLPQTRSYHVLARLLPQLLAAAHSTGNASGGGELDQVVTFIPLFVSASVIVPSLTTASSGFSRSDVVHASVNALAFVCFTVTFSSVGVGL